MGILPCRHRLIEDEEGCCWLESNRLDQEGLPVLVFCSPGSDRPLICTSDLAEVCPWRSWGEAPKMELVPCPYCNRRHRQGSTSQQLCEAWSAAKGVLKTMRKTLPEGKRYFSEGTRELPYPDHASDLVRRLVWKKMKTAVLRRDRYRCQECDISFGKRRRKVFDPSLRLGSGGYKWESLEVHHIIPRSRGGSDHPGNLMTLCPSCHLRYTARQASERAARRRDREEFLRRLEDEGDLNNSFYDPRD